MAEAAQHVLSLDSGLLRTTVDLVRRPAGLIRDVFAGRTVRYAGPVRYFLVAVTAAQLLALALGDVSEMAGGFTSAYYGGSGNETDAARVAVNIERFWVFAFVGLVPFVVLWSRLLLRRAGLTLAEHAVAHLHLLGQTAFFVGLALGLGHLAYEAVGEPGDVIAVVCLVLPLVLYLWASVGIFRRGRVWSPLATTLSLGLGFLSYSFVLALVLVALGHA